MSDPFRLRLLKGMTAALKTITPANGYVNDLSDQVSDGVTTARVFRGRDTFDPNDGLPLVSILEHPRALEPTQVHDAGLSKGEWELLVQGFVQDDRENPTDPAYSLVAEVIACLVKEKAKLREYDGAGVFGLGHKEPCVVKIEVGQPVCRPPDGINADVAFFWITVVLTVSEDLEKPFA